MFILKAETLGLQNPSQPSITYLGKVFGQQLQYPIQDRVIAEERCRCLSKSGQLSLLVEFTDSWVLFSEGMAPQMPVVTPSRTLASVAPAPLPPDTRVEKQSFSFTSVAAQQVSPLQPPATNEQMPESEPEYREIRYRGSVIRQPIAATSSTPAPTVIRSYRGSSY